MYGNFSDIQNALLIIIFNNLSENNKNIAIINCMMNVYYKNNLNEKCMKLFRKYLNNNNNIKHDIIFYTIILASCCNSGQLEYGKEIH